VGRARNTPAEAPLDRADVDDRLRAAVGVRLVLLPRRNPVENRLRHLVRAQDRVLAALPLAERRVDEVALDADAEPERAEVPEDDLALGRLSEQAHVGDTSVADEVPRARGIAAELRALCVEVLRLLDLAAHGGNEDV